jgi:drug/metabolite transporter (DMT)-like permease
MVGGRRGHILCPFAAIPYRNNVILCAYSPSNRRCVEIDGTGHFTDSGDRLDQKRARKTRAREEQVTMVYLILLLNIVLLVAGQTIWKLGLEKAGGLDAGNWLQVMFSPLIMLGILIYGAATVLWLYVLSRLPISVAYPLQSFAFVLAMLIALFFFKESIPVNRWIGTAVILAGISILSWR